MDWCSRSGCSRPALARWWVLCADCTVLLLEPAGRRSDAGVDQLQAAGWDAVTWAERIAPGRWGNASDDGWVTAQRCLAFAAVVTGRSSGCVHTATDVAVPVIAVARAVGVLHCPSCAETVVAATATTRHACDRCGRVTVSSEQRVALVAGASLILVGHLCAACFPAPVAALV
jgi:ribosomal protein S27E